jgi:hypothetical protein
MRNTRYVLIITAFLLLFSQIGFGQTYAIPRELKLDRHVRQSFPQYFGRKFIYPQLIPQAFYPMGWSRDGKFAYDYEPVDEACGCYFANLVIHDMRTDKVVWEFEYNQDKLTDDKGNMPPEDNIRKLWNKHRKLFSQKLAENGIIAGGAFQMLRPTFTIGGRSYTAKSEIKWGKNADYDENVVNVLDVMLMAPGAGSKKVYTHDNSKEEFNFSLNAGIIGVIKSPYENRVAIIAMTVERGWEGPPHNGNLLIAGADLTSGFSK